MQKSLKLIATHSPYLERLVELHPEILEIVANGEVTAQLNSWIAEIYTRQTEAMNQAQARLYLRSLKQKLSLMIALCDLNGDWDLQQITGALSLFADACVQFALEQIYRTSIPQSQLVEGEVMSAQSGIAILGMGKLGGYELNYSSDIDLIALYDPDKLELLTPPARNRFVVRIIQHLASFLQDKQEGGYVFRVDLRLRPDPASTGLAVAIDTATSYYEKAGQNWERAAMIKARPIAGDLSVANQFLRIIQPFIWRNHLDFAAIDDILSIKRQMQAMHEPEIAIASHHMKTGYGGIREIEFLAQIHQLIWGGRAHELRLRPTCEVLNKLVEHDLLERSQVDYLIEAYQFYRMIEHRLQMKHDQQTHIMPATQTEIEEVAEFCGFDDASQFQTKLLDMLNCVHMIFTNAFQDSAPLGFGGKLVFTGVDNDVETLQTLRKMGFKQPEEISKTIQQWHTGSKKCTRTKRAREILTELVPLILSELGATVNPDVAFHNFDSFLTALPVGVQPFSLFNVNRALLSVVAGIVGNAPVLANQLSHHPQLLDILVERGNGGVNAGAASENIADMLADWLKSARSQEEWVNYFCSFKLEHEFRIGVNLLEQKIDAQTASTALTKLADAMLATAVQYAASQLNQKYDAPKQLCFAIIGLGKLGTTELMIGSDLDVMCIYDIPDAADLPDDEVARLNQYYNRLTTRVIHLLEHPTKVGNLYEMDTKLRPYGAQGSVAVKLDSFRDYYSNKAWVVEHLALVQGRIIYASDGMNDEMQQQLRIAKLVDLPAQKLFEHVNEVRKKINTQYFSSNPWDIKYVWGGLMDLQWIVKTLIAKYSNKYLLPDNINSTNAQLKWLYEQDVLSDRQYQSLHDAQHLMHCTLSYLRLCHGDRLDEQSITEGLQILLYNVTGFRDFAQLKQQLLRLQSKVYHIYQNLGYM